MKKPCTFASRFRKRERESKEVASTNQETNEIQTYWELSSAGSEHLPYKQGVTGSNPVAPTIKGQLQKSCPFLF